MVSIQHPGRRRHGLSLLEVLVALAVFLFSYVAIWQLMNNAGDEAIELGTRNEATRIAQSALARIAIGDLPMQSQGEMPYDDDGEYTYAVEVQEGAVLSLQLVSVTVTHPGKAGANPVQVQLSQMMLMPTYIGSPQDVPPAVISSTSTTTTGTTTGTTGN